MSNSIKSIMHISNDANQSMIMAVPIKITKCTRIYIYKTRIPYIYIYVQKKIVTDTYRGTRDIKIFASINLIHICLTENPPNTI